MSGIPIFLVCLFCSFPSYRNFLLTGSGSKKKCLEHYIFVCLSILRIAECLAPGHVENLFWTQELDILVSSPGLSSFAWFAVIELIKLLIVTTWNKVCLVNGRPRVVRLVLLLCFLIKLVTVLLEIKLLKVWLSIQWLGLLLTLYLV